MGPMGSMWQRPANARTGRRLNGMCSGKGPSHGDIRQLRMFEFCDTPQLAGGSSIPRKLNLQRWREDFAEALRGHEIESTTTSRIHRTTHERWKVCHLRDRSTQAKLVDCQKRQTHMPGDQRRSCTLRKSLEDAGTFRVRRRPTAGGGPRPLSRGTRPHSGDRAGPGKDSER